MKKLLKSILIATASIGTIAGSVTTVISCGEQNKPAETSSQANYDSLAEKVVKHFADSANIIAMKHAGIENTSTKAAVNYIQDEINSYIQNGADVTANERLTVNNVIVNSTDATFDTVKGESIGHANVSINPNNNLRPADLSSFAFTYSVVPNKNDLFSPSSQYKVALSQLMNYIPEGTYYLLTNQQTDTTEFKQDLTIFIKTLITKNKSFMFGALSVDNIDIDAPANAFQTESATTVDAESGDISITVHALDSSVSVITEKMKVKYQVLDSSLRENANTIGYYNKTYLFGKLFDLLGTTILNTPVILMSKTGEATTTQTPIYFYQPLTKYAQSIGYNITINSQNDNGIDFSTNNILKTGTIQGQAVKPFGSTDETRLVSMNFTIKYAILDDVTTAAVNDGVVPLLKQAMQAHLIEVGQNSNSLHTQSQLWPALLNVVRQNPLFESTIAYDDDVLISGSTYKNDITFNAGTGYNLNNNTSLISKDTPANVVGLLAELNSSKIPTHSLLQQWVNLISPDSEQPKYFVTNDADWHIEMSNIANEINSRSSYNPIMIQKEINDPISQTISIQSSVQDIFNSALLQSSARGAGYQHDLEGWMIYGLKNSMGLSYNATIAQGTISSDALTTAIPSTPGMHTVTLHNVMFTPKGAAKETKLFDTLDVQVMVE